MNDFELVGWLIFGQILYVCIAQFTIMPVVGALIGKYLGLPPPLSVGLVLLGCCPGGIASSVVSLSSSVYFECLVPMEMYSLAYKSMINVEFPPTILLSNQVHYRASPKAYNFFL